MDESSYGEISLRSAAILDIEIEDEFCFLWSILASLHPCNNNHPNRVSYFRQNYDELNIDGFHFTNGLKCSDVHKIENIKNLSVNIVELSFSQNQNN